MPRFAELAPAAEVRVRVDAAPVEPESHSNVEPRRFAHAVAAVAREEELVRAVELRPFLADDVERHLRAVLRRAHLTHDLDVVEARGGFLCERSVGELSLFV